MVRGQRRFNYARTPVDASATIATHTYYSAVPVVLYDPCNPSPNLACSSLENSPKNLLQASCRRRLAVCCIGLLIKQMKLTSLQYAADHSMFCPTWVAFLATSSISVTYPHGKMPCRPLRLPFHHPCLWLIFEDIRMRSTASKGKY